MTDTNDQTQYMTGALRSPNDTRDWVVESILHRDLTFPKTLDLRSNLQPIRNQGSQGSCAAQTAACMKEWQERKDVSLDRYMSPQFVYNNRSNQDSSGMYGRDVMKILNTQGCCLESLYLYGTVQPPDKIPKEAYDNAHNYLIEGYAQVNTIDGLKGALYKNGPCYIAFPTYNKGTRMWKPEHQGQEQLGGHAMTVVGYDDKGFIIRNSWGDKWGDKGYCTYLYEDWGSHWEAWTTVDASSNQIDDPNRGADKCLALRHFLAKCKRT